MTLSYIPMILDASILPDGEAAQILSMVNNASVPVAVALATNSLAMPYRKGRMRVAFLLQDSAGNVAADGVVNIRIRSPWRSNPGVQGNRPIVTLTPANAASALSATAGFYAEPTGGLPGASAPATAADYSATFNSKTISNWGITINHLTATAGALGVYVQIDFGASISS